MKRQSKDDFKGRQFEAWLIIQAISWYLRYPLSYRDLEEMFLERGFEVDHNTINRWVLAYAPLMEKRLRRFRDPPPMNWSAVMFRKTEDHRWETSDTSRKRLSRSCGRLRFLSAREWRGLMRSGKFA
ncbi:IS6100 transposase [Stappia aggregata IAM 12614]|uniref:IS6100 transposase n=1 Tax=Roseibium aggregatum (strain ATCC 25650 / DSM 13394 / JCM 20685 / NBRC 16684 / NCIMB 2208 / IAM 12614 / B1) TaxID=384765 RepID=A0P0W5_ROSAI|nr:IS6100 transposase [Stappia aggregata IAM 12614] [Roseibium aggregatum IAM 12614]